MSFDSKESSLPPRKKGKKMKQRIKANNQLLLNMELRSRIELESLSYQDRIMNHYTTRAFTLVLLDMLLGIVFSNEKPCLG